MQFRPDTSFPYLAISRAHNVDYGLVLNVVEKLERHCWPALPVVEKWAPFLNVPVPVLDAIITALGQEMHRRNQCKS